MKFVVKRSLSVRFMSFLPPVRANLTVSVGQFPRAVFFGTARRIAAGPGYRKQRPPAELRSPETICRAKGVRLQRSKNDKVTGVSPRNE